MKIKRKFSTAICALVFAVLLTLAVSPAQGGESVDTLTYAVYTYLPDIGYYQDLIEARWAELEPDITLVRAGWDCYEDGMPEGIDVIMYDAVTRDRLIQSGWIQPVPKNAVQESGDIFPYVLEGLTVQDELYGIPVFLCGNFLIYDLEDEAAATAEHLPDLAGKKRMIVANSENPFNRPQYIIETVADTLGAPNPSGDSADAGLSIFLDQVAVDEHKKDSDPEVAKAYDSGVGCGYIGFSESMRFLEKRMEKTGIRAISFSDGADIHRVYVDAAAVTSGVEGVRYEKCLELMNVMAEADVLTKLSVQDGRPQYLLLARKRAYAPLIAQFPIYAQLEELAESEDNHIILTP